MPLLAICIPILPGQTERWRAFVEELRGPRYHEFEMSRERMHVRERSFFQHTPDGDYVLVTLEGPDPASAYGDWGMQADEFTDWFVAEVKVCHGIDLRVAFPEPLPEQVIDSKYLVRV